jgi:hypothetical protein
MNASRQTRLATRDELIDLAIAKAMFRDRAQFLESNPAIQTASLRVIERIARQMTWYVEPAQTEAPKAAKSSAKSTMTAEERSAKARAAAHKAWETMRARRAA